MMRKLFENIGTLLSNLACSCWFRLSQEIPQGLIIKKLFDDWGGSRRKVWRKVGWKAVKLPSQLSFSFPFLFLCTYKLSIAHLRCAAAKLSRFTSFIARSIVQNEVPLEGTDIRSSTSSERTLRWKEYVETSRKTRNHMFLRSSFETVKLVMWVRGTENETCKSSRCEHWESERWMNTSSPYS